MLVNTTIELASSATCLEHADSPWSMLISQCHPSIMNNMWLFPRSLAGQ